MPNRVFIPLLILSILIGQGIVFLVSRYFSCVDFRGHEHCKNFFLERSGVSKPESAVWLTLKSSYRKEGLSD
jgi:hypothetical protein